MPKTQRSLEEVELVRENIMAQALDLIIADGYDGFSMRKLANRLGIAAKTIYNYFHNRDELYLYLLTNGFEQLYQSFTHAANRYQDPMDRLKAVIAAYVEFGLENRNMYDLMFTLHVPKFNDYVGTPMEKSASYELTTALKCADFFMDSLRACLGDQAALNENEIRVEMIQIWSHMHGYVAGINNNLLDYMHDNPLSLKQGIIDRIVKNAQAELSARRRRCDLKTILR